MRPLRWLNSVLRQLPTSFAAVSLSNRTDLLDSTSNDDKRNLDLWTTHNLYSFHLEVLHTATPSFSKTNGCEPQGIFLIVSIIASNLNEPPFIESQVHTKPQIEVKYTIHITNIRTFQPLCTAVFISCTIELGNLQRILNRCLYLMSVAEN